VKKNLSLVQGGSIGASHLTGLPGADSPVASMIVPKSFGGCSLQIPILMYHSISSGASRRFRPFTVPPERFEEHVRYIRGEGFTALTVSEFVRARDADHHAFPAKPIVLTFDDGFADFHDAALPILSRYGVTATLYVVSSHLGSARSSWLDHAGAGSLPMLSWSQVAEIEKSGIEIGAHTMSHPALDTLPLAEAREEIASSKRNLEDGLGVEIRSFAYPYGYYSGPVRDLVASAGYASACAVRYAMSSLADDRFALCRQIVRHEMEVTDLDALLRGKAPLSTIVYRRFGSGAWRFFRQSLHRRS
jgi:peptidoglycan/xylan/chitin deacetylase (PgdA/CDA1 family)